uniref:VQ domain-containing protein n=1 Tax=Leersia perrieri TaxID=77586 RepID=A0A0D9X7R0_9ORYZ
MDSGNSGSLQSSSGGDDEFDSRCGGGGGGGGGANSSPLSALLRQSAGSASSFYGLQDLASPSLSHTAAHQWTPTAAAAHPAGGGAGTSPSPSSPHGSEQLGAPPAMRTTSRKRTRASRRAPTTVLTTDTSNFRAMVQEFTGIPSPPFAGGAPTRSRSAYLLRPFAQKLHNPSPFHPFPSPSTSSPSPSNIAIAAAVSTAAAAPTTVATAAAPGAGGERYQLSSAPPSSLLGMQDHGGGNYLSFQSHLAGGDSKYAAHPMFDAPGRDRMQDPAGFLGLTHGIMAGAERSRGGDELFGVVGGASMTTGSGAGGCKKATYSSGERNAESTSVTVAATTAATAAMRTQSVDSWICTSE